MFLNCNNISQCYCIFNQINIALVNINRLKTFYLSKYPIFFSDCDLGTFLWNSSICRMLNHAFSSLPLQCSACSQGAGLHWGLQVLFTFQRTWFHHAIGRRQWHLCAHIWVSSPNKHLEPSTRFHAPTSKPTHIPQQTQLPLNHTYQQHLDYQWSRCKHKLLLICIPNQRS